MTLTFPFEIGQAVWVHTEIDGEWVTVQCEVKEYSIDEYGVEVTVRFAGGRTESYDLSSGYGIDIDAEQVRNQLLFADRNELMDHLRREKLI